MRSILLLQVVYMAYAEVIPRDRTAVTLLSVDCTEQHESSTQRGIETFSHEKIHVNDQKKNPGLHSDKVTDYLRSSAKRTLLAEASTTQVTAAELPTLLRTHNYVFVNFGAPWTVWGQRLQPTWDTLASMTKGRRADIAIVTINCQEEESLCKACNIHVYPTLQMFDGDISGRLNLKHIPYKGDRTYEALARYVERFGSNRRGGMVRVSSAPSLSPQVTFHQVIPQRTEQNTEGEPQLLDPTAPSILQFVVMVLGVVITVVGIRYGMKYHMCESSGHGKIGGSQTVAPAQIYLSPKAGDMGDDVGSVSAINTREQMLRTLSKRDVPPGFRLRVSERPDGRDTGVSTQIRSFPCEQPQVRNTGAVGGGSSGGTNLSIRLGELLVCYQEGLLSDEEYQQARTATIQQHVVVR